MNKWGSYFLKQARNCVDDLISVIQIETSYQKMLPQNQIRYSIAYQFSKEFNKFITEVEKEIQIAKDIEQANEQHKIEITKQKYDIETMIKILKEDGYKITKEF